VVEVAEALVVLVEILTYYQVVRHLLRYTQVMVVLVLVYQYFLLQLLQVMELQDQVVL
jgi:hypothetical protein